MEQVKKWVAGDAKNSERFEQAMGALIACRSAASSKVLWAGNTAIFLGACVLASPDGDALVKLTASLSEMNGFDVVASFGLGYSFAKLAHRWIQEKKSKLDAVKAIISIDAAPSAFATAVRRLGDEDPQAPIARKVVECLDKLAEAKKARSKM